MFSISVLVPTYRRIHDLERCLNALKKQTYPLNEVLVTIRNIDSETWDFFQTYDVGLLNLKTLSIDTPGVVAAMNAGYQAYTSDIIVSTDDDGEPHDDWLEKLVEHFTDPQVAGVGGRDWQYVGNQVKELGEREIVGKAQWFGRVIGNHHLGVGLAREVDVLKGVNMGFRRSAIEGIRFDERMRGTGAQAHFELAFTLRLRKQGWKLIYDPRVAVNHYPAQRFDEDGRDQFNALARTNAIHNETLAILDYLNGFSRGVFILWSLLLGTREAMGLIQWIRFLPSEGLLAGDKCWASLRGRWQGYESWRETTVNLPDKAISLGKSI